MAPPALLPLPAGPPSPPLPPTLLTFFPAPPAPPEPLAPANPKPLPTPARGAVSFDNVTFHYPSRPEMKSLDGFSLHVRPGDHLIVTVTINVPASPGMGRE